MKKARLLVLDVIGDKGLYEKDFSDLQDYYDALRCECFDIATRKIGDSYFDLFVNDVGLFADNPIPSILDKNMKPMLVGNVVFANHDFEGNTTSLSDEDIEIIKAHAITAVNVDKGNVWTAIYPVSY